LNFRFLDRLQPLALLVLRVVLGVIMTVYGYHKVFGGMHKHVAFVASMGMPGWLGYVSAFTELLGGILLVLGLFTRLSALAVCVNMLVAVFKVELNHGLINGYEFPLALAAMAFALIFLGSGAISIDWVMGNTGGIARK